MIYTAMLESIPTPVNYISSDYVFKYVNKVYAEWLDMPQADIIGKKVQDIVGDPAFAFIKPYMDEAFAGKEVHYESEVQFKNKPRFIKALYVPHINGNGIVEGYVAYLHDITDLTQTKSTLLSKEKELKKHEALQNILAESIPVGVYSCDKDGYINFYNPVAVKLWGYTPDITNEKIRYCACKKIWLADGTLITPENSPMAEAVRNGKAFRNIEAIIEKPDGTKFHASINIDPLFDKDGAIIGAVNVIQDISDFKNVEFSLKQKEQEYEHLINILPIAIYTCNADGSIQIHNEQASKIWGREPTKDDFWCGTREIYSTNGEKISPKDFPTAKLLDGENIFLYTELIIRRSDGTFSHIIPFPKLIYDLNGDVTGAITALLDTTELRNSEKTLRENEQRLRLAAKSASFGTWDLDLSDLSVNISEEMLDIFNTNKTSGWTRDFYISMLLPEDRPIANTAFINAMGSGHLEYEVRLNTQNEEKWIKVLGKTIYGHNSKPLRLIGTVMDITNQKITLNKLRESETRFRIVADDAPVMIWMSDPQFNFVFINKRWIEFTGTKFQDELGAKWTNKIHPDDVAKWHKITELANENKKGFHIEIRMRRNDGVYRWQIFNGVPRFSATGKLMGFIGSCFDITEKKLLIEQKDEFLGIVSHELKTPLTSLKAYVQIIREQANDEVIIDPALAARMEMQIDKLNILIKDISDITRIENGRLNFRNEQFNIADLINEICTEFQRTAKHHSIITEPLSDLTINTDKERLGQVLTNLLTNAVKYSPKSNKVIVRNSVKDNVLTITVKDFGIGIPAEMQQNIFERFYRIPDLKIHEFAGLGLGLYISAGIIERMNGKIWVDSEPGKGSEFHFSIPAN